MEENYDDEEDLDEFDHHYYELDDIEIDRLMESAHEEGETTHEEVHPLEFLRLSVGFPTVTRGVFRKPKIVGRRIGFLE